MLWISGRNSMMIQELLRGFTKTRLGAFMASGVCMRPQELCCHGRSAVDEANVGGACAGAVGVVKIGLLDSRLG
jgi:hypothetical protein